MIHDVDESLRTLARRDALDGSRVELAFDAPTREWAARQNSPIVSMYLYDIREDVSRREVAWETQRGPDRTPTQHAQPPRRFRLSYLITAWTQRPEDEHRLLSSMLACFLRHPVLPTDALAGDLARTSVPVLTTIALPPPQDRSIADVWSALGGELKPSLDLVVTAPLDASVRIPAARPCSSRPASACVGRTAPSTRWRAGSAVASPRADRCRRLTMPTRRRPWSRCRRRRPGRRRRGGEGSPAQGRPTAGGHGACGGRAAIHRAPAGQAVDHPGRATPVTLASGRVAGEGVEAAVGDDPSLVHLAARLALLEQRVRAAVDRRRATDPDPDDRFRGLYVPDAMVDRLLDGPLPLFPDGFDDDAVVALERPVAAQGVTAPTRLHRLARGFGLGPLDMDLFWSRSPRISTPGSSGCTRICRTMSHDAVPASASRSSWRRGWRAPRRRACVWVPRRRWWRGACWSWRSRSACS
ncbi:MAG: DUF4255 domain-containing protein [Chloroflexota bacterium]